MNAEDIKTLIQEDVRCDIHGDIYGHESVAEYIADAFRAVKNNVPYHARIDQPSKRDPLHSLNGRMCIAWNDRPGNVRLFFTEGPVHSMDANPMWISRVKLSSAED